MDIEEFRARAHALVDWIADFRVGIAARPVQVPVQAGDVLGWRAAMRSYSAVGA
jgi:aromatic-L-amino-acid decarboxylase